MNKDKLMLSLLLLFGHTNSASKSLGEGLELGPVAQKVKPSLFERIFRGKAEPTHLAILTNLAFAKHKIDNPVWLYPNTSYTIKELLNTLDVLICQKLVQEKRKLGLDPQQDISDKDFKHLNSLKKEYLDALPAVLTEVYGESAKPYIAAIDLARQDFEARHNGALLKSF